MKVTPLEIRQKQFEKKTFGGLDKDEVQAYLNSLSLAWEKMAEEQVVLRSRLDNAEREVERLRGVESSLYQTLKSAEETGKKSVDQATQQAQLIVQEARLKADTLYQEARWKAGKAMEQVEDYSRKSYNEMVGQVKVLEVELRHIENLKDTFLSEIKLIARDLLEKAEKAEQRSAQVNFTVPPPPEIEMARPFLEEKEVEAVIDTLEIPENQQMIGFSVNDQPVPVEEDKGEANEEVPAAEEIAHRQEQQVPAEKHNPAEEEGSFFDRI